MFWPGDQTKHTSQCAHGTSTLVPQQVSALQYYHHFSWTARGKWQRSWATHLASKCPGSKSAWAAFCETTFEWFPTRTLYCNPDQCHSLHMSMGSKLWLIAVSYRCLYAFDASTSPQTRVLSWFLHFSSLLLLATPLWSAVFCTVN